MAKLTGGEALVKSLTRHGVRVVFGLPGVQIYGAICALRDEPGIRFIQTRHEGATSYMADGYARAGGTVGAALVVPGPGLLNTTGGLSTAYAASSPVLMIAGQIPKTQLGKRIGVLHEVDDQLDAVAPVTKWRKRILEVRETAAVVDEAMKQLCTGRPRPVVIDMPWDTMQEEAEVELPNPVAFTNPAADRASVDRAAEMLLAARRPLVYAGGGVHLSGAHDALAAVADHLQAGVATSPEGKGAVSDRSPLSLGAALWAGSPLRRHIDDADVVLVVGSRLAVAGLKPEQQVIQIDADPDEIGRNHAKTLGLVGDASATLTALADRLRSAPARESRKTEWDALRARITETDTQEPQSSIVKALRAATPEDAVFVAGMTQIGYYSRPFWPVYHPRTYLTSSYSGNLGFEYPTALGAKVAKPDRAVVAVIGDGGFLYNATELATAAQHRINVVAVVFNDGAYGNVARDLDDGWGGAFGAELVNPDFMKLADAFGVAGMRAGEPAEVGRLVRDAVQLDRPVLIEVPVGRMPRPKFFMRLTPPAKYRGL
ncbi:MAG: thiamine pyrophosphate-binding protein [Candidatus Rokubacteria bacterium]|nr:thiamine pyrophosphate-binding protein [Candidatus Rokubacteria bacterium]